MKRVLLTVCLFCALLLTACTASTPAATEEYDDMIVVGFSQVGAESDWRNAHTRSMMEALSEQNGYRLIIDDAQQKQERQITAIRNFIHQGVDYIVLAPTTMTGWDTVLTEAKTAGVPVIIVDRMIDSADENLFTCYIGSDFRKEGDDAVDWMERNLPGSPRIVHLQGNIGTTAQQGRTEGLDAGFHKHPEWQLVYRDTGDFTQAKGQELVEALLAQGIQFDVIYSENDNMTYGAIDALKNTGLTPGKDVAIVSFDAARKALEMVMAGEISYDVECNPLHGPRVKAIIEKLEAGGKPAKFTFVEETSFEASTTTQKIIDSRGY